jgi:hypothetical protein
MLMGKVSNCSWYNQAGQEMMTVMRVLGDRMIMGGCGGNSDTQRVATDGILSLFVEKCEITSR